MRLAGLLPLTCAATLAAQTPTSQLIGRVVDHDNREGLAGATVRLANGSAAVTDKRGWFLLTNVLEGRLGVAVELLGYQVRQDTITIQPGNTHDIEIRLSKKPIQLPPLAVTVRSRWLEENGFYARRMSGLSTRVITAADLERRNRTTLTDVFHEVPSIRVVTVGSGSSTVKRVVRFMSSAGDPTAPALGNRSQIPGCEPALFIDGVRYRDRLTPEATGVIDSWDMISPLIIEAIEIYKGGAAPMNFNDNCGTVLIWTKRGR
jgi:hypothetical protein